MPESLSAPPALASCSKTNNFDSCLRAGYTVFMNKSKENSLMEAITSLCKRRGFIFPGSEIYGGLANAWDYGPLGVELKNNIKNEWWKRFVQNREDMVGFDSALLMNTKVYEASGHLKEFSDPLVECKKCHERLLEIKRNDSRAEFT